MHMAGEFYGYFDSVADDEREYDGAQFAHVLRASMQNGVTSNEGGGLVVTAEGGSMKTTVSPGGCMINGYLYVLSDDGGTAMSFVHPASASNDRWDRIVVRLMNSTRSIGLRLLTGTPGAAPVPPALTRNSSVYELSLAKVKVRASAESVEAADIVDERWDESVCGEALPVWLNRAKLDARYITSAMTDGEVDAVFVEA